jgi:hypothetical protein
VKDFQKSDFTNTGNFHEDREKPRKMDEFGGKKGITYSCPRNGKPRHLKKNENVNSWRKGEKKPRQHFLTKNNQKTDTCE